MNGRYVYIYNKNNMEKNLRFSKGEELANAVSHLVGALLSVAGLVIMLVYASRNGNAWHVVSVAIFGATLILLYLSSSFNHILKPGRVKDFFFNFDQIAIFLLIAGTYTPVSLIVLHGPIGWIIFSLEWALALTGIGIKVWKPAKFESGVNLFYIITYVIMGWMIIFTIVPVVRTLPVMGWLWILIGGVCYSVGIIFFKLTKFRYHHLVWHMLVIAGSLSHFFAVFFYMIP